MKKYEYNPNNDSWYSESAEKVYERGLKSENGWSPLSLYDDEYENLVNYLLDEKKFYLNKKYTSKLGYDIFINEKLDLYVVIMKETTYGFFDEKHFMWAYGNDLGLKTPSDVVMNMLKEVLWNNFDLTKDDVDLLENYQNFIGLKTKEPINVTELNNILNQELKKYKNYPIEVEVELNKKGNYIIWIF